MSVTFQIITALNLVHVRYDGFADLASTVESAETCTRHPDFKPGLPHYFDLSHVTGYEHDFVSFFALQAKLADIYLPDGEEQFAVFNAPSEVSMEMARLAQKSWSDVPQIVIRIVDTEAKALALLGLTPARLHTHTDTTA